MLVSSFI